MLTADDGLVSLAGFVVVGTAPAHGPAFTVGQAGPGAGASALSSTLGALVPLIAVLLRPTS
ncbi:MAG: hypothetical protein JWR70_784 [Modestobacter sp.]|nr:hypothetical protein [Modestobacter sp.]